MNPKVNVVVVLTLVAIGMAEVFFLIGNASEPFDPYPRAVRMAKCSNNSSTVFYQRKTGWFTSETEWFVEQVNQDGKTIRRQVLFTSQSWYSSEMHWNPEEFCEDKYWTSTDS